MTTKQLSLPVIVLGRKLVVLVALELHDITIQNPRNPSVYLFDGMSGVTELERGELKTRSPQEFQDLGKELGRDLLVRIAQHYIHAVRDRGALARTPAPLWVGVV